ncbi:MAG: hypothetical protein WA624_00750 [Methylocella sp.]
MSQTVNVILAAEDRERLLAIARDRSRPVVERRILTDDAQFRALFPLHIRLGRIASFAEIAEREARNQRVN